MNALIDVMNERASEVGRQYRRANSGRGFAAPRPSWRQLVDRVSHRSH